MKLFVVTCGTGGPGMFKMTFGMTLKVKDCMPSDVDAYCSVVFQSADLPDEFIEELGRIYKRSRNDHAYSVFERENRGFAWGMNRAIAEHDRLDPPDYILCLNNDLEFPRKDWLKILLHEAHPTRICSPLTDKAALHTSRGPLDQNAKIVDEISAYAWLVPYQFCQWLKKNHGFWLFSEEFGLGYAEDNWTAILLRRQFGDRIFKLVPRSWVRHLKAKTASFVKPDRRKSTALLRKKIDHMLATDKGISRSLRNHLRWYLSVLKC